MGDFNEHVLFGFLMAAVTLYFADGFVVMSSTDTVISAVAVFVGAVLPDIDHTNSYVHRAVKSFVCVCAGLGLFLLLPLEPSARFAVAATGFLGSYGAISSLKIRHRGFTHSISFCVIVTALVYIGGVLLLSSGLPGVAAGVGLSSHLVMDREFKLG